MGRIANLGFVRDTLIMTLRWINNLVEVYGMEAVLDCLPNNTGGRGWIREALLMLGFSDFKSIEGE